MKPSKILPSHMNIFIVTGPLITWEWVQICSYSAFFDPSQLTDIHVKFPGLKKMLKLC